MIKHVEIGISGEMLNLNSFELVRALASELGLGGALFTKKDGSVKIIAEGEEELLIQFADKIKNCHDIEWQKDNPGDCRRYSCV